MNAHEQQKQAEAYLKAWQPLSELHLIKKKGGARNLKPQRNVRDFKG